MNDTDEVEFDGGLDEAVVEETGASPAPTEVEISVGDHTIAIKSTESLTTCAVVAMDLFARTRVPEPTSPLGFQPSPTPTGPRPLKRV